MKDGAESEEYTYNFGKDMTEALALHGETAVFSEYLSGARVTVQGWIRSRRLKGKSRAEVQAEINGLRLKDKLPRLSAPMTREAILQYLTQHPEEAQELLGKLEI